ncbi:MAG: VWA domain-containing protein [Hormoscilla sp.]
MLNVTITPHREFLPADRPEQKLFVMLKLRPTKEAAATRPSTALALIIDTSSSMDEVVVGDPKQTGKTWQEVPGGKTKREIAIASLENLLDSGKLTASDRLALIQFDDNASSIIGLTAATAVPKSTIARLGEFSGGTRMGLGMQQALTMLSDLNMTCRRALLFTDGQTCDEDQCRELAGEFARQNIPITALGMGDFNEDLLNYLSDVTGGRPLHVVTKNYGSATIAIADLPDQILAEFLQAQQEAIANLALTVKTIKGVKLTRVVRAYPGQAEFLLDREPFPIGNAWANDDTVFILEFTIESHVASRVRIAQLGLTYDIPGKNQRGELQPQNLVVQFMAGANFTAQVDPEVMGYMQQCNIVQMIDIATRLADQNPRRAAEMLETARRITKQIGNDAIASSLVVAKDELRRTQKISAQTRRTIKMGSKGKTVKMASDINNDLEEEEIRKASGT